MTILDQLADAAARQLEAYYAVDELIAAQLRRAGVVELVELRRPVPWPEHVDVRAPSRRSLDNLVDAAARCGVALTAWQRAILQALAETHPKNGRSL